VQQLSQAYYKSIAL